MKNLLIIVFLTFTSLVLGQKVDKEIYLKHSFKQDGLSYQFTVLDESKPGVFHYNKSKYYYWFKAQKVMSTQGGASGLLLNGLFESFYENKQLNSKGKFNRGLKNGEWIYWRTDGSIERLEHWKNGSKYGKELIYNEKGVLTESTYYKCNSYTKTTFDKDGVILSSKKYKNGKELMSKDKEEKTESDPKTNPKEKKSFNPFKKSKTPSTEEKDKETKPVTETKEKKGFKLFKKKESPDEKK